MNHGVSATIIVTVPFISIVNY